MEFGHACGGVGQVFDSYRVALGCEVRVTTFQVLADIVLQVQFAFGDGLCEQEGGNVLVTEPSSYMVESEGVMEAPLLTVP